MKKIRVLHSGDGDWEGLYIDNKLVAEGHSLELEDVIKLLLPECNFGFVWDNKDEVFDGDRCPLVWTEKIEKLRNLK